MSQHMASMGRKKEAWFLGEAGTFSSPSDFHIGCGNHTALESDAYCSRQPGTEVKNVWICTSTFQYLYLLWCVTMHKKDFIVHILYYDQPMHNYLTNYHTPTCFDTVVSSSGIL
jgi:hypothetical protein